VVLGHRAFESPGELRVPIAPSVRPSFRKVEGVLVFQCFGRGVVGDPVRGVGKSAGWLQRDVGCGQAVGCPRGLCALVMTGSRRR
jgi:hypothetical protein